MDDNNDNVRQFPEASLPGRSKRPELGEPFTHTAYAYQRVGKRWGIYREVGVARVPPCPHCGAAYDAKMKVFLNRLPVGGFSGGLLIEAAGTAPPKIAPDHPGQAEVDEDVILPEG
jgi:hypothetical protein